MSIPAADRPRILVSACLLGRACTWDGDDERRDELVRALDPVDVVEVCPEVAGGLPVPRPRCEVEGGDGRLVLEGRAAVRDAEGLDHGPAYVRGARVALDMAVEHGVVLAVLKARSPSCGSRGVYDGTHEKVFRDDGIGVTAALLRDSGIALVTEDEAVAALADLARDTSGSSGSGAER